MSALAAFSVGFVGGAAVAALYYELLIKLTDRLK